MFDMIYNFIHDFIFGSSSLQPEIVNNACSLITIVILVVFVVLLIRLVMWAFYLVRNAFRKR